MMSWKRPRLILKDGSSAIERSLLKSRSATLERRNDFSHSHTASAGCSRQQQFSINRFNGFPLARGLQRRMPHVNSFVLALLASLDLVNAPSRTDVGQRAAAKASANLSEYSYEKGIYMKINFFNADHIHALIDLPTNLTIEQVMQLLKGSSSHWINQNQLVKGRFAWGRGYGAFSVSHSDVSKVADYIARQEEHHRKRSFAEEYELFINRYGLEWHDEGNR